MTLDVNMPHMDGLAALEAIFAQQPVPVIMVSSLTTFGATTTLDALDRGALDYVAKPDLAAGTAAAFGDELLQKIRWAAHVNVARVMEGRQMRQHRRRAAAEATPTTKPVPETGAEMLIEACVAIGISTGGPPVLTALFEAIAPPMPPVVIVQHMPVHFTGPLAWRLDGLSSLSIKEAENDDSLRPNQVLIARGGCHLQLRRSARRSKRDFGTPRR